MLSGEPCDEVYFVYFRQFDTVGRQPGAKDKSQYNELSAILFGQKGNKIKTCLIPLFSVWFKFFAKKILLGII